MFSCFYSKKEKIAPAIPVIIPANQLKPILDGKIKKEKQNAHQKQIKDINNLFLNSHNLFVNYNEHLDDELIIELENNGYRVNRYDCNNYQISIARSLFLNL